MPSERITVDVRVWRVEGPFANLSGKGLKSYLVDCTTVRRHGLQCQTPNAWQASLLKAARDQHKVISVTYVATPYGNDIKRVTWPVQAEASA